MVSDRLFDRAYNDLQAQTKKVLELEQMNSALRARVVRLEEDETRINTLRELCGYVEDGSDTSVTIGQDDATKDWVLHIGNRKQTLIFSDTFKGLLDTARRVLEEK